MSKPAFIQRKIKSLRLFLVEFALVLLLFLLSAGAFIYLVRRIFHLKEYPADQQIFRWVESISSSSLTKTMEIISFFGSSTFLIIANCLLALYMLFWVKDRWLSVKIAVVALGSVTAMRLLKLYFSRPRPEFPLIDGVGGFSFPSGHSMSAMTFFGLVIYLLWRRRENAVKAGAWSILFLSSVLLIGFSRIYLRVHYLSDVLAGFFLGLVWLILSISVLNLLQRRVADSR